MAYINKQQYERRRINAEKRALENFQVACERMNEDQANLLIELCTIRHKLHTNMDRIVTSNEDITKEEIVSINESIFKSGLQFIETIPHSSDDYIDIDNMNELIEFDFNGDQPERWTDEGEETTEWKEWYNSNYERIYKELENLNKQIEDYLSSIDKKYNTNFCPTGKLRIM